MIDLLASASGGQPKGYAKTLYKGLNKQKKEMDKVKSQADEKLQLTNGDLIDVLPRFVPGVKLAREMRRWDAAKAEYRKQLAGLENVAAKLKERLTDLGGPHRLYSINELLAFAQGEERSCKLSTQSPPASTPNKAQPPTPKHEEPPEARAPAGVRTAPVPGACRLLHTC